MRRIRWRRIVAVAFLVALGVVAAGGAWLVLPQRLLPQATAALTSTAQASFAMVGDRLEFRPASGPAPSVGLIIYPGAKVEAAAYAPTAAAIAARGYFVTVVPMPLNLAFLGANRADEVMVSYPRISHWVLAGHSLGGAMAGQFAAENVPWINGVAFWASYPNGDLSGQPIPAAMIYGTLDGGLGRFTSQETRATLPAATTFVPIEGGNHEQMGWYTGQAGDPPASISREEQQRQLVEATVALLETVAAAR